MKLLLPFTALVGSCAAAAAPASNQSDALHALDIKAHTWRSVRLPRRVAFTRDIEIAEDGTVYTSTSNFSSWLVDDAQPSMIRVQFAAPAR